MTRPSTSGSSALVGGLALVLLLAAPALPVGAFVRGVPGVTPEVAVLVAALWALQVGAWRQPVGRAGSWRSWVVALPWALLVIFECARAVTKAATNEDLPLYDSALLARHLYILGRDLYGGLATAALVAVLLSPLLGVALGAALFGRLEATLRALEARRALGLVAVTLAFVAVAELLPGTRWVSVGIVRNASASAALYRETLTRLAARTEPTVALVDKPDVIIYVVESYGAVCATARDLAPRWTRAVDALDATSRASGWTPASGWSKAPVQGGRSWIADMSVLLGVHVAHQSTYEHVLAVIDDVPSLPRFFARNGYETVLVKPADRVRPGVLEENHYRFGHTVFAEDLDYRGSIVGWGRIPDQYTIEYVQEHVLDPIEAPTFAFFHLATAHLPWADVPPLLDDWRSWNDGVDRGREDPVFPDRSVVSELGMQVSRFRKRQVEAEKAPDGAQRAHYLGTVLYDLAAIEARLRHGPRRPTLVVVMGDHQPPVVARGESAEVPVHLFASDPALLEPFLARGFGAGSRPAPGWAISHSGLFDLLVEALAP